MVGGLIFSAKFQPSAAIMLRMGTRLGAYETSLQALRRREPLLDAWLEAMNRLSGPSNRITTVWNNGSEGRPLLCSRQTKSCSPSWAAQRRGGA
jgi:hypothetical protein